MASGGRDPRDPGMSPFKAGLMALVVVLVLSVFGFSRYNPFSDHFTLKATFEAANNLQTKAPVRIAGIEVGKVKKVESLGDGTGAAHVEMEIEDSGLPIHKDAQLKIRPRIFLEGNSFVDLQPGTPSSPTLDDGAEIPVQQTATPVQFSQLLQTLQRDTRTDLQTFLEEYAVKGLGNGGAEAYNRSLTNAPEALRNASIANEATLGQREHDLSRVLRGQQRLFREISANPEVLKDLVVNLNTTAEAFGRNDAALQASVPALRDTLRVGRPALASLNGALPSLRAFSREALPGVRSSGPTIDASLPFITQARLLVRRQELRGLARDLRFAIPDLARVNHTTIPLLDNQRALSACTSEVLVPFAKTPINDPDFAKFEGGSGEAFFEEAPRGLVGLAGESRINDAMTPYYHVQTGSGPANVVVMDEGEEFFASAPKAPEGVRPIRPESRPVFRPGIPCETQENPNLDAAGGPPSQTLLSNGTPVLPGLPLPPLPKTKITDKNQALQFEWVKEYMRLTAKGQSLPDPLDSNIKAYPGELRKAGWATTKLGKLYPKGDEKAKAAAEKAEEALR
ncbi:MAG TPA: MlaD family protein [Thermoleophilaceae bacterium]|jgi:virulence factor Mce-like protein